MYVISVYKNNDFIGYIKSVRKHRNEKYRFEKTKDIDSALKYRDHFICLGKTIQLKEDGDNIYNNYVFVVTTITSQEIRKSKLNVLEHKEIKTGLFKIKKPI